MAACEHLSVLCVRVMRRYRAHQKKLTSVIRQREAVEVLGVMWRGVERSTRRGREHEGVGRRACFSLI